MAKVSTDIDIDEALLCQANELLRRIKHPVLPSNVHEVGVEHFVALYETITQEDIPGSMSAKTAREKANVCQFLIDSLADDIFGMNLDHITGFKIVTGNRKCISDLLDIFSVLIDYDDKDVDENNNGSIQLLPTPLRDILAELQDNANYLAVASEHSDQQSTRLMKSEYTQTTPVSLTSSTTSPLLNCKIWSDILGGKKGLNSISKNQKDTKKAALKPISVAKIKPKPPVTIHNLACSQKLTKVPKPKPVLSTKIRRKSSSLGTPVPKTRLGSTSSHKWKAPPTNSVRISKPVENMNPFYKSKTDLGHMIKLLEDAEKIRCRRQEINNTIRQLQDEDKTLKSVESILLKEIKLSQQIRTHSRLARSKVF